MRNFITFVTLALLLVPIALGLAIVYPFSKKTAKKLLAGGKYLDIVDRLHNLGTCVAECLLEGVTAGKLERKLV